MPFWELGPKLEELSIGRIYRSWFGGSEMRFTEELDEGALIESVELPPMPVFASASTYQRLHYDIVYRTIITAARGGKLRRLCLSNEVAIGHVPFTMSGLLPFWVGVEVWSSTRDPRPPSTNPQWFEAAITLRRVLAHASLWLPEPSAGSRSDRLLSGEDVEELADHFEAAGVPTFTHTNADGSKREPGKPFAVIELYLPWLQDDPDLADDVADAWNAIVERGEADVVKCECELCKRGT